MQRQTAEVAVVAALCILALSAAAATIDTATVSGGPLGGSGSGDGAAGATDGSNASTSDADGRMPVPLDDDSALLEWVASVLCVPALTDPGVILPAAVLVAASAILARRRYGTARLSGAVVVVGVPALTLSIPLFFTLGGCEPGGGREVESGGRLSEELFGTSAPGGGTTQVVPESAALLVAVVGVAVAAALAALVLGTGDDVEAPDDEDDGVGRGPAGRATARIASTAGAAADRIEGSGDLENEVFRAWREMTTHLAVERPASSTPAEFRSAAVEAGVAPEHVTELTALFEDVRYGGRAATAERERRAVEALRRIEAAYGDDAS